MPGSRGRWPRQQVSLLALRQPIRLPDRSVTSRFFFAAEKTAGSAYQPLTATSSRRIFTCFLY